MRRVLLMAVVLSTALASTSRAKDTNFIARYERIAGLKGNHARFVLTIGRDGVVTTENANEGKKTIATLPSDRIAALKASIERLNMEDLQDLDQDRPLREDMEFYSYTVVWSGDQIGFISAFEKGHHFEMPQSQDAKTIKQILDSFLESTVKEN